MMETPGKIHSLTEDLVATLHSAGSTGKKKKVSIKLVPFILYANNHYLIQVAVLIDVPKSIRLLTLE